MVRKRMATPFEYWRLWVETSRMMAEAQAVIGLRMLGMAGLWPVAASETTRMVAEKMPAFIDASGRASVAAMAGKRPDQIAGAALKPIGAKTRSNARRLAKRRRR